jgi:cellulose synthase/poly-beta-1,6-N-acetylglucosamine synthase-like glycosyltransferase
MQFTLEIFIVALVIFAAQLVDPSISKSIIRNTIGLGFAFFRWRPIELSIVMSLGVFFRAEIFDHVNYLAALSPSSQAFLYLFIFKFFKVIVHTISYHTYRPTPIPHEPSLTSLDCTVIIPTVGDMDSEFIETVESILTCNPADLIISTVGAEKLQLATRVCAKIDPNIICIAIDRPNKRNQFMAAVSRVNTVITVSADDHIFWPKTFLHSAIASFEDPHVGLVGTVKRVRREKLGWCFADFLNFVACLYLERHNFECTASHNIDGGVFVISGRTALFRTSVIQDLSFAKAFMNEYWLWGKIGPMNVDDDNFICRWMVTHRHGIVFHNSPDALMATTLGTSGGWTKFRGQLDRWARTTWRSNSTTLFANRMAWRTQPWCIYAVYFSAFINFALFYEVALFATLYFTSFYSISSMKYLCGLLFLSKIIKPLPHYMRNPMDLPYLPLQILFGYYHSWVKLNALLTCANVAWGTRAGVD